MVKTNKKALAIIFITVFVDLVGFGIIIPLSPYLADAFGATALEVGLLMSIYSVMQFLVAPIWGQLSDRIGRRPVILVSLLGAAISHALFGWASSLLMLFFARALAGGFGANISTAMAYIADVTPESERSKGMGLVGAAFGLGFVLGPGIGGLLANFGTSVPAYAAGAICFLNFIAAIFILKEPQKGKAIEQKERHSHRFKKMFEHLKNPKVGPYIFYAFLITFALANVEAPLFLYVKDRFDWGIEKASFGFAYVGLVMAFTQGYLIRRLLPAWGEKKLMFIGSILFSLGLLVTAITFELYVLALAMTALALGNGFFNPSANGTISVNSENHRQGEVMGVVQSLSALARIIAPPLGGWMYDLYGSGAPFYGSAAMGLAVAAGLLLTHRGRDHASLQPNTQSKAMSDPLYVGRFQLENILRNEVPYVFLDLRSEKERDEAPAHSEYESAKWIFERTIWVGPGPGSLDQHIPDQDYPVLILCQTGENSYAVATRLESQGHRNVFIVEGGALGLLASDS